MLSMPNGLAPDPNDKDALGRTAMHLAAWAGVLTGQLAPLAGWRQRLAACSPLHTRVQRAADGASARCTRASSARLTGAAPTLAQATVR